jgi:hypothetical protein
MTTSESISKITSEMLYNYYANYREYIGGKIGDMGNIIKSEHYNNTINVDVLGGLSLEKALDEVIIDINKITGGKPYMIKCETIPVNLFVNSSGVSTVVADFTINVYEK